MKIKKSSWHYKVASLGVKGSPSQSLCIYFWQVVFAIFIVIPVAVIFTLAVAFFATLPLSNALIFENVLQPIAIPIGAVWIIGLTCNLVERIQQRKNWRRKSAEPSLLLEYLKAKKRKVCPVLEFE